MTIEINILNEAIKYLFVFKKRLSSDRNKPDKTLGNKIHPIAINVMVNPCRART